MPAHQSKIVFITVTEDRVAVMTRRVHRSDPTPASTKVNRVLPARKPAAVTYSITVALGFGMYADSGEGEIVFTFQ